MDRQKISCVDWEPEFHCRFLKRFCQRTRLAAVAAEAGKKGVTGIGNAIAHGFSLQTKWSASRKMESDRSGSGLSVQRNPAALREVQKDIHILSKLEHKNGTSGGDGGGDHARANASFLTGVRPYKTAGADIRLGVSVDQMVAKEIGDQTRFSSLEMSCDGVRKSGVCDSGYSCAYQFNLSWRSATTPMTPEANPRLVFERLFGAGPKGERHKSFEIRNKQQRSLLDFVMEDARQLNNKLGRNDKLKLDEYLTGVREIEQRIVKAEKFGLPPDPGIDARQVFRRITKNTFV